MNRPGQSGAETSTVLRIVALNSAVRIAVRRVGLRPGHKDDRTGQDPAGQNPMPDHRARDPDRNTRAEVPAE